MEVSGATGSVALVDEEMRAGATRVVLSFSDGDTREVTVEEGESVLAAAKRSGYALASQCEVGTCCTCVGRLTSGVAQMPAGQVTPLTREETAAGHRLLCQVRPETDAAFELDYPSSLLSGYPTVPFVAKIQRLTWVAASVVQLDVRVPKSLRLTFLAGQYCRIKVPGTEEWRSYSMASGEHEQGKLSFLIRVLPSGAMSDYLRGSARAGETLEMEGPIGGFVLEPSERPHLLVAGGTGLAPMLSMLDKIRLVRPTPPVLLVFGCVAAADLFLTEELEARTGFMPTLTVRVALERPEGATGVVQGNPVEVLEADDIVPGSVAYLCGPPGMVAAAEHRLVELGVRREDVHAEQFLPS
ncbi:anthranilate 1,2-dioxygenase electron transfer component AntC [Nocardioides sp. AN3]